MARKKKEQMGTPGAPAWMATYGDMITLVLTFFVLLFSMSSLDIEKFKALVSVFQRNPDIFITMDNRYEQGESGVEKAPEIPDDWISEPSSWWFEMAQDMQEKLDQDGEGQTGTPPGEHITIEVNEAQIILRCQGEVLFDTLSDTLKPEGVETLRYIMEELVMEPWNEGKFSELHVEGHADIRRIPPGHKFEDNLILSAARAAAAYRYIADHYNVSRDRLGAVGYGDSRPLVGIGFGATMAEWDQNRRVEFVLYRNFLFDEEGNKYEHVA